MQKFIQSLNNFKNDGLSIIITAYKSQDFIEECLDSIQNQNYFKYNDNYEILLGIDACETTLKKVKEIRNKYKNLKVFYATENGGTYRMRNSLWIRAKYDNILFFDSDDVMPPNFVDCNMKYIREYDLIRYKIMKFISGQNKVIRELPIWFSFGSIITKKKMMYKLKGFSDERISMDMELVKRMEKIGVKEYHNNIFYWYRVHKNQLTVSSETSMVSNKRKIVNDKIYKRLNSRNIINDIIITNNSLCRIS